MEEKVRVRIAVAVDAKGNWNAAGWGRPVAKEQEAMDIAVDGVDDGEVRYWVEADLIVPRERIVSGNVIAEPVTDEPL